jgi:hypothetical protein
VTAAAPGAASSSLEDLLVRLFSGPAQHYFIVLRNDETLPLRLAGTDLDVCVCPGRKPRDVLEYVSAAASDLGWLAVGVSERPHMLGFSLVRPDVDHPQAVHFDVFNGLSYLGVELCSSATLASESSVTKGVRHLSRRGRALATLVHHMAWNGYLSKEKYRSELGDVLADPADALWVRQRLSEAFGRRAADRLLFPASRLEHATLANRVEVAWAVFSTAGRGHPARPVRQLLRYWSGQWSSLRSPPGLVGLEGDSFPAAPGLILSEELACTLAPHGCAARTVRSRPGDVHTLNGERYRRTMSRAWARWTLIRWLIPSFFLRYQAKRNRIVVLRDRLPSGVRLLRRFGDPTWIAVPSAIQRTVP